MIGVSLLFVVWRSVFWCSVFNGLVLDVCCLLIVAR